jgi:hypothetical protein
MTHVTDDLELYALGALPDADRARVSAHLGECPACREQARLLEEVAIALPATLPEREVPARLRGRILASARVELAAPERRATSRPGWLSPGRLAVAGLATVVVVLGAADVALVQQRNAAVAERDEYADLALRASHGGRNWYMFGVDAWAGSGGTLYAPAKPDASAYAVFHDLRPVDAGSVYALWLVDADGRWLRAANFTPSGAQTQLVVLDTNVERFYQCALTIESSREGKRAGPLVMQSRIAAQ